MNATRTIDFYKDYFIKFYLSLDENVQHKYEHVFVMIRQAERIPIKFFKKITGKQNLFEIRVESESNIYRTFCCLDKGNVVVLFNSFQKKKNKTPKVEIDRAEWIKNKYYDEKGNK